MATWEGLLSRAKSLEARLEHRVQRFSQLAQRINADMQCDEEVGLVESKEEASLSSDIERDLTELSECINGMRGVGSSSSSEVLIKRYHEIHFDYSNEFKNTSATVQRKRESIELFQSSNKLHMTNGGAQDSSVAKLLRERSSIAASMKSINDVIAQAWDTKNSLLGQRSTLQGSHSGISGLAAQVPSFGRLIDGIQRKKLKESLIVAVVVGLLLCLTLWYVFLRQ